MPFSANRAFKARPRLFVAADGVHYRTDTGRQVLDATSGLYCVNAGHGRRRIVDAIKEAAERLDFAPPFQYAQPQVFELANRLALLAPGDLNHVMLATSGSEAVETAMKVALAYHRAKGEGQRTKFIGRERAYHGVGFGGIAVGGIPANRKAFGAMLPGTDHLPSTYDRAHQAFSVGEPAWGAHLADELNRLIALHDASNIAAVIVEPTAGSTGCLPPPQGYLERLVEIAGHHGILVIFDEVITGFGRLGHAFAAERYGLVPDLITFAKGVTNGSVPMSGVLLRDQIYRTVCDGEDAPAGAPPRHLPELFHGYTYSGHPLATAAALATLDVYRDEALFERTREREAAFAERMMSLQGLPNVADIRPIGLMCGIDLHCIENRPGQRGYRAIETSFHELDLYVRVALDTLILAPPLIATDDELDAMTERVAETIRRVQ
ncbi:MAG: aminotransferase class III-fold pyridoxal phosphate-dependent enzyme [Pseudomonadota bacterium]